MTNHITTLPTIITIDSDSELESTQDLTNISRTTPMRLPATHPISLPAPVSRKKVCISVQCSAPICLCLAGLVNAPGLDKIIEHVVDYQASVTEKVL